MKKLLLILLLLAFVWGCSSESDEPITGGVNNGGSNNISTIKGEFISGAHTTIGSVSVNSEKTILSFTNFKTDSGPKLLVYLTTEVGSSDFVSLGELIGTSGSFTYNIPNNTDLSKYKIVDIWCIDFSVSFGHAELK